VVRRITGLFTLRRLTAAWPPQRLGHYATLHSHTVAPAHFASPGNLRFPVSGLQKRHIQPERYAPFAFNFFVKKISKKY
jgi:hypothetical protein